MHEGRANLAQQLLGAVDLAIDFATLGEYGLEPGEPGRASGFPRNGPCGERSGREAGWEALAGPTAGSGRASRRGARCRAETGGVPLRGGNRVRT